MIKKIVLSFLFTTSLMALEKEAVEETSCLKPKAKLFFKLKDEAKKEFGKELSENEKVDELYYQIRECLKRKDVKNFFSLVDQET